MAENAETTAPGTHPDAVVVNSDGSVTTKGGRGYVWCTDEGTGHRMDFPARLLPRKGVTPVPGVPVNYKAVGRSPKVRVQLGDSPPTAGHPAHGAAAEVSPELAAARAAEASVTGTTDPRPPSGGEAVQDPPAQDGAAQDGTAPDAGDQPTADNSTPTADAGGAGTTSSTTTSTTTPKGRSAR